MEAPSVAAGLDLALRVQDGSPVCCWGSLYTVDEARVVIRGRGTG
jgi:hypothetical protein